MSKLIVKEGFYKQAQDQEGPTFQQQFGILSNANIVEKYPQLSTYKIAFQLIDKNDDNTQAIGAVVYQLGKNVIFIPSFFRSGKIKTGDVMFIPLMQQFLPVSDAWMAWLKNKDLQEPGTAFEMSDSTTIATSPGSVRTKQVYDPIIKTASARLGNMFQPAEQTSILDTIIHMGKKATANMLKLLTQKPSILNATLKFYSPEQLDTFAKQASLVFQPTRKPNYVTILPFDKRASMLTSQERQDLRKDGFVLKKLAAVGKATKDLKVLRTHNINNEFMPVNASCKCQLLQQNGELQDAQVLLLQSGYRSVKKAVDYDNDDYKSSTYVWQARPYMNTNEYYIKVKGAKGYTTRVAPVALISSIEPPTQAGQKLQGKSSLASSNGCVCICGERAYRFDWCSQEPMQKIDSKDGSQGWTNGWLSLVLADKDNVKAPIRLQDRTILLPKQTRIVSDVADDSDKRPSFLTQSQLPGVVNKFVAKHYNKVKVYSDGTSVSISTIDKPQHKPMQVKEAALKLADQLGVGADAAKAILRQNFIGSAFDRPKSTSYYIQKRAAADDAVDTSWKPSDIAMDSYLNKGPNVFTRQMPPLINQDPVKLLEAVQTAAANGIKQVFDVSTLKLMAQTTDISQMVMQATKDYMKCLDSLCRLLFQFYWQAQQMEQTYGASKMKNLQSSLKNSMDSLSDLTVFLKLKGMNGGMDMSDNIAGALAPDNMLG